MKEIGRLWGIRPPQQLTGRVYTQNESGRVGNNGDSSERHVAAILESWVSVLNRNGRHKVVFSLSSNYCCVATYSADAVWGKLRLVMVNSTIDGAEVADGVGAVNV